MPQAKENVRIDAGTFQEALASLTQTMVQKVFREGIAQCGWPSCVSDDITMILRYSLSVYRLLFYLNADVRRQDDPDWHVEYGVTAMSLVRSLIDCLYNVTLILQNPAEKGPAYRKSGLRRVLNDLNEDHQAHLGEPEWDAWFNERRPVVEQLIRNSGFTLDDVEKQPSWQTLGAYINTKQHGGVLSDHQAFLKTFTHLGWRQYSALSHGAYEAFAGTLGHVPIGAYYMSDFMPHDSRPKVDESYELFVSTHIGRAATVLLCIITELQAYCRFDGANINERIRKIWDALTPLFEAKELYDGRYSQLMLERRILRQ
jgi:hypothetical protein